MSRHVKTWLVVYNCVCLFAVEVCSYHSYWRPETPVVVQSNPQPWGNREKCIILNVRNLTYMCLVSADHTHTLAWCEWNSWKRKTERVLWTAPICMEMWCQLCPLIIESVFQQKALRQLFWKLESGFTIITNYNQPHGSKCCTQVS